MKIEEIDKNFAVQSINGIDVAFMKIPCEPFELDGLPFFKQNGGVFCRVPVDTLPQQNDGIKELAWHTAGVQLRFRSDTEIIALRVKLRNNPSMEHMAFTGSSGFDLYVGTGSSRRYCKTARPCANKDEYESLLFDARNIHENTPACPNIDYVPGTNLREFTLNFPAYNGIKELEIGLSPKAVVEKPAPFKIEMPVVFYGSSITQGGCASRPGNVYIQHLSRRLDANVINLGFSGSCRAEKIMADVINSLDMSAFVLDYDHNAPSPEFLKETHEKFFKLIRAAHPDLPIIFISRPDTDGDLNQTNARLNVIETTFKNALAAGDKKVFLVNGYTLFGIKDRDACTVDGCHPNDIGFIRMADAIEPTLRKALGI